MEEFLKVGIVSSTHGVRGEVKIFPTTDDVTRFKKLKKVYMDFRGERKQMEIENVKFFKQFAILKFRGVDTLDEVETWRGAELYVERKDGVPLEENEYYIADLIGLAVFTEDGAVFGTLKDVMETGANDVYIVDTEAHGEVLIPAIRECIRDVDVEGRKMVVHLLEGLI